MTPIHRTIHLISHSSFCVSVHQDFHTYSFIVMRWIFFYESSLAQDQSLDLLTSSPTSYHCTTDAPNGCMEEWRNEWCLCNNSAFKVILGRRLPGLREWVLVWTMRKVQNCSLYLLTCSPARYDFATAIPSSESNTSLHHDFIHFTYCIYYNEYMY